MGLAESRHRPGPCSRARLPSPHSALLGWSRGRPLEAGRAQVPLLSSSLRVCLTCPWSCANSGICLFLSLLTREATRPGLRSSGWHAVPASARGDCPLAISSKTLMLLWLLCCFGHTAFLRSEVRRQGQGKSDCPSQPGSVSSLLEYNMTHRRVPASAVNSLTRFHKAQPRTRT